MWFYLWPAYLCKYPCVKNFVVFGLVILWLKLLPKPLGFRPIGRMSWTVVTWFTIFCMCFTFFLNCWMRDPSWSKWMGGVLARTNINSGIVMGGAWGQSATPDNEKIHKIRKSQEKMGKKKVKIVKVLSLCPSWQILLAMLLPIKFLVDMLNHAHLLRIFYQGFTNLPANYCSVSELV